MNCTELDSKATPLVLVADDDRSMRLLIAKAMNKAGFSVAEAADGAQALQIFDRRRPDIILMDVDMPVMDGYEACAKLRRLPFGESAPIIMVTGRDDVASVVRAYEAGATDFVMKPINWVILAHRVRYMFRAGRLSQELYQNKLKLANAQRIAGLGWWEWNIRTNSLSCSEQLNKIFVLQGDEFVEPYALLAHRAHPEDLGSIREALDNALIKKNGGCSNFRIGLSDGSLRSINQQIEVAFDGKGMPCLIVGIVQDVTDQKRAEDQIKFLAYRDSLTGLPNRRLFIEQLDLTIAQALRSGTKLAVLYLDMDRFKRINETLGQCGGDLLLANVAKRLLEGLRRADYVGRTDLSIQETTLARLGGDEFVVLLRGVSEAHDVAKVAQRIIRTLSEPFDVQSQEIFVSMSIGIAIYPADGDDADTLISNADSAMYHAKELGRDSYQFYTESMNATAFERLLFENSFRKAIKNEEFTLYYQPQVEMDSREIIGLEALVRWRHPELGVLEPSKFIPLAEETGLIIPLGEWVMKTACEQNKLWQDMGFRCIPVAVNVSAIQWQQKNWVGVIRRILSETGLDPGLLDVELTETAVMHDLKESARGLSELKELGIRLSIDDFGTGYSSLGYLKRFPIDSLKIDHSFMKGIPEDSDHAAITNTIISMAKSLRLDVVAEGVETEDQISFLLEKGCMKAQGYFFGRPVDSAEMTKHLRNVDKIPE